MIWLRIPHRKLFDTDSRIDELQLTPRQLRLYDQRFQQMEEEEILWLLQDWHNDGGCEAACEHECWVEPDGICPHGNRSWLCILELI